jgi:GRF zinc finger
MFACRCCQKQFSEEEQRNYHEGLCCLALPPGSVFVCKYCNIKIAIYKHSSFLEHETRCSLNPSVQAACAVLRTARKNPIVSSHKAVSGPSMSLDNNAPVCDCAFEPKICVVSVAHSDKNYGRRYYRCSKWKVEDRCRFFRWVD